MTDFLKCASKLSYLLQQHITRRDEQFVTEDQTSQHSSLGKKERKQRKLEEHFCYFNTSVRHNI